MMTFQWQQALVQSAQQLSLVMIGLLQGQFRYRLSLHPSQIGHVGLMMSASVSLWRIALLIQMIPFQRSVGKHRCADYGMDNTWQYRVDHLLPVQVFMLRICNKLSSRQNLIALHLVSQPTRVMQTVYCSRCASYEILVLDTVGS